jgi:hypothetical protein
LTGGGAGTVTGGTITWPGAIFNTPTTGTVSSGTMTFAPTLATQTASTVLAGPVSGTATPSFRQLQLADISAGSLTRGIVYIDQDGKVKAGDSTYYYRPGQYLVVNGTQNSITGYAANNFSTGNNASSGYTAGNDAGTSLLMRVYGSNYTDVRYQNRSVFSSTNGFTFFPYGIGVNVPKYADYRFYSGVTGGGRNGEGRATPMVWFRQSGQVLINGSDSATLTNPNTLLSVNGSARLDTLFANVVVSNAGVTGSGGGGSTYTLPIASGSTLGGIKVGSGLSIAGDGTLSAAAGSSSSTPTDGWALGGNSGTAGANFLGTTDNRSLRFRTNNNEQFVIDSTGYSFAQAGLSVGGLQKAGAFPAKWKSVQTVSDGDFKPLLALMGSEPVGTAGGTDSLGLKGLEYFYFGSNTGGLYGHYNKARGNWLNPTGVKANDILWGEAARGYLSTGNQFSGSAVGYALDRHTRLYDERLGYGNAVVHNTERLGLWQPEMDLPAQ